MTITIVATAGASNANSYSEIDFIDQYHADRGNTKWGTVAAEDKKACAIRATDYIDKRFGRQFKGTRMQKDQRLAFPRLAAFDDDEFSIDGVPTKLMEAQAEYALRAAIYNVLAPDPLRPVPREDMTATDPVAASAAGVVIGALKSKSVKAGPVESSKSYETSLSISQSNTTRAVQSTTVNDWVIPQYPEADLLIEDLIEQTGSITLERA